MKMMLNQGSNGKLYKNNSDKTYVSQSDLYGKLFLIEDSLQSIDWKIGEEVKMIGKHTCFMATALLQNKGVPTNFKSGQQADDTKKNKDGFKEMILVTAWLTLDIPVVHGSAMYHGFNYNLIDDNVTASESLTQRYKASVLTNYKKGSNFELGYQCSINEFTNSGTKNTYYTDKPFAKIKTVFLKDFSFTSDYSFYNYSDGDNTLNSYSFLNANLYYKKKDSKWEYRIGVKNILNTSSISQNSYSEVVSSTSEYYVQPRYGFFTVKYHL